MIIDITRNLGIEATTLIVDAALNRFSNKVTRVIVYEEETGPDEYQCTIEARPAGLPPIVTSTKANNIEEALNDALDKMVRRLDDTFERRAERRIDVLSTPKE
jgi:ribosome-associated translation inhibitor RaiA